MARIFKTPFSAQGDTEQVPEAPQGDGSVSLTQGFGYDYEREYEDPAAKDIRRGVMNGLFHDITEAIGDIQLTGIAKWNAAAAPYPAGAVVWHSSVAWMSTAGNNRSEPADGSVQWEELSDSDLRQDLADPDKGAAMVARGVVAVDSIADLLALPAGQRKQDLQYLVKGYHPGSMKGGGVFFWVDSAPQSEHDGGLVISNAVPWTGDLESFLLGEGATTTDGMGCWVRQTDGSPSSEFNILYYGGIEGDSGSVVMAANAAAINALMRKPEAAAYFPSGDWYVGPITTYKKAMTFLGETRETFPDRELLSRIWTKGGDFVNVPSGSNLTNIKFVVENLFFTSLDQSGSCFATEDVNETAFYFRNVTISQFFKGFYAPVYSSSCIGDNISFIGNYYGCWGVRHSNTSRITRASFNWNARGCRIMGFQTTVSSVHLGVGYTGAGADDLTEIIGLETRLGTYRNVYAEAYGGGNVEKVTLLVAGSGWGPIYLYDFAFPAGGDTVGAKHIRVYPEDTSHPVEWLYIRDARSVPNVYGTQGIDVLVRGIIVNDNYGLKTKVGNAYFGRYDLSVELASSDEKHLANTSAAGVAIRAVGYTYDKIVDVSLISGSDRQVHLEKIYESSTSSLRVLEPRVYRVDLRLFSDQMMDEGSYEVAIRYRDKHNVYRVSVIGTARAVGSTEGSRILSFLASVNLPLNGYAPVQIGFLRDSSPSDVEIQAMEISLRIS